MLPLFLNLTPWRNPDYRHVVRRQLDQARLDLLSSMAGLERETTSVQVLQQRIKRLEKELK
jgi:hypothetical protein